MACENCGQKKCCCVQVISKQGLQGKQGIQGPAGPAGPSAVYLKSTLTPYNYIADGFTNIFSADFIIPTTGFWVIWYEATFYPPVNSNDTISIEIRKNATVITNAQDEVKYLTTTPNESYKNSINTGALLTAGDHINVLVSASKAFTIGHRSIMIVPVTLLTTY